MLYAESLAWKYLIYHKTKELPCSALTPTPCFGEAKKIYRLQLMVSTLCNLDCKYCYASGGTYKTKGALMQREQIDKIMEQIRILQIKEISNVFFFGGEPLLNIEVIEYVCDRFEEL